MTTKFQILSSGILSHRYPVGKMRRHENTLWNSLQLLLLTLAWSFHCLHRSNSIMLMMTYIHCYLFVSLQLVQLLLPTFALPPHLNGAHFRITVLEEKGFLDIEDDEITGSVSFSGYLIDMLKALSKEERGNFSYTLLPPSGYGSLCVPRLDNTTQSAAAKAYDASYRTQYNCGASDVNDLPLMTNYSTEIYLGMYYVTPARQLENQFTVPFVPPYSGTLAMFGTATGIPNFEALVEQQKAGLQPEACAPGGTALIDFVAKSYPGIKVKGVFGDEDDIYQAFLDGTCQIFITDGPIAAQFVLRRSRKGECKADGLVSCLDKNVFTPDYRLNIRLSFRRIW